jgi:hypothetical protein
MMILMISVVTHQIRASCAARALPPRGRRRVLEQAACPWPDATAPTRLPHHHVQHPAATEVIL